MGENERYGLKFAASLRALREKRNLTGKQLAERVTDEGYETSWRAMYHWEQGDRAPPMDALPALARALGVAIRQLFPKE